MTSGRNIKILGTGASGGGTFDSVTIRGEGDIDSDITCEQFKVMGTSNVHGSVSAQTLHALGTMDVEGTLHALDAKVTGELTAGGDVKSDRLRIRGSLTVGGDCTAERFKVSGAFTVDGLLNAERVTVGLYGPAYAKEIGGKEIVVRPRYRLFGGNQSLTAEVIEGDDIRLTYTTAKVVRGNRVEIGPGCDIERVEYKHGYRKDAKSNVGESVQM